MVELDFLAVVRVLQSLTLGGVSLAVLVIALVEAIKTFTNIAGNTVRAVALGLGFGLTAVAYGLAQGLIPAGAEPYITWFFVSVTGGLGAMGLWHLGQRWLLREDPDAVAYTLTERGRSRVEEEQ